MITPLPWLLSVALGGPISPAILLSMRMGQPRMALPELREAVRNQPDDPDLYAWLGLALAHIGQYAEAVPAFEMCAGSTIYERNAIGPHADALRATGEPEAAAALRLSRALARKDGADAAGTLFLGQVDDWRWAGRLDLAEDAAWAAIAEAPSAEQTWAALADVYLDAGDLEEARATLWVATRDGRTSLRGALAEARLAMAEGDYEAAEEALVSSPRERYRSHRLAAMESEILRRQGFPEAARANLEVPRLPDQDRPEVLAERAAAAASAGELVRARTLLNRALSLYPRDPDVLAAAEVLEKAAQR